MVLSTALEEEINILDFVLWLTVLLDCFPLFLHFLIFSFLISAFCSLEFEKEDKTLLETRGKSGDTGSCSILKKYLKR